MSLCAICGSGSRCLTHDANREAIDTGRPARVVGLAFDAALSALDEPERAAVDALTEEARTDGC